LPQLQAHHKDTIETKEKRMQNEILRYQQEAEEAKLELERMRAALSQTRGGSVSEFSDTISGLTVRLVSALTQEHATGQQCWHCRSFTDAKEDAGQHVKGQSCAGVRSMPHLHAQPTVMCRCKL
jgi:hypothetical protein